MAFRAVSYRFEVKSAVAGELPEQVEVLAVADGAACGFELEEDETAGVVLHREDGTWVSGLCRTTDASGLLAADDPHPPVSAPVDSPSDQDPVWPWLLGAVAAGALGIGAWLVRRRFAHGSG